jgi:hypothetical protein
LEADPPYETERLDIDGIALTYIRRYDRILGTTHEEHDRPGAFVGNANGEKPMRCRQKLAPADNDHEAG